MAPTKQPCVYILASAQNVTLYVGVTSDLPRRVAEHKNGNADGFTKSYNIKRLVWYELHADMEHEIKREKQIKRWRRAWKLELIETSNPHWDDLFASFI